MKSTQQYKSRRLPNAPFVWRDGLGLVSYNGRLWVIMGWNPDEWVGTGPANNTTEVWSTVDGIAWQAEAPFPASPSHTFGCVVKNGLIWVVGTDGQNLNAGGLPYVWTFDGTTWVQVSASWGADVGLMRNLMGVTVHKDYIYVVGGQNPVFTSSATFFNNIYRSLDGVTWSLVANFPTALNNRSMPCVMSLNGKLYIAGGFTYTEPTRVRYTDVYVSENDGLSWNKVGDLPVSTDYQNSAVFDGKLWVLDGAKEWPNPPAGAYPNRKGIHFSDDGATWETLNLNMGDPTHATGFTEHDGKLWVVCGNLSNQVMYIEKVL